MSQAEPRPDWLWVIGLGTSQGDRLTSAACVAQDDGQAADPRSPHCHTSPADPPARPTVDGAARQRVIRWVIERRVETHLE